MSVSGVAGAEVLRSLATIRALLAFDTTSDRPNIDLLDMIVERLLPPATHTTRYTSVDGTKQTLLITVPDRDGALGGGVMLAGHLDTVPTSGQHWSTDPFVPTIRDGRLHARGAADMKAFCGAALAALPQLVAAPLAEPVSVALTYDEETGCAGARQLVRALIDENRLPRVAVVGEPTSMRPVVAHKGCLRFRVDVDGVAVHSSLAPLGVNAVAHTGRLIADLADLAAELAGGDHDRDYAVPHATLSIGPVHGGVEVNIVPDRCTLDVELRPVPGDDVTAIRRRIDHLVETLDSVLRHQDVVAGCRIRTTVDVPPLRPREDSPALAIVAEALGELVPLEVGHVSYGTEAGLYQEAGIDTVVLGPGSIEQAHIPDEFVEIDQIRRMDSFLDRLVSCRRSP